MYFERNHHVRILLALCFRMMEVIKEADDLEKCGRELGFALKTNNIRDKIFHLEKVKELFLITNQLDDLLDSFLDEILTFMEILSTSMKIYIIEFIEQISRRKPDVLRHTISSYVGLLGQRIDDKVLKTIIRSCARLYPFILLWMVEERNFKEANNCWGTFLHLKAFIFRLIEDDNEGLKTMAFKFLEAVIICQSNHSENSPLIHASDVMSLNQIPFDHRFISYHQMKEEAVEYMKVLLDQMALPHISYQNLVVALGCLINIVHVRKEYFSLAIEAFEILHVNLPPTLTRGQVKSIRKELKKHLLRILLQPMETGEMQKRIETILIGLGVNPQEIQRTLRSVHKNKAKKRTAGDPDLEDSTKKKRDAFESTEINIGYDEEEGGDSEVKIVSEQTAVEVTTDYIFERLNFGVVVNLAMISLVTLPDEMPPSFQASYTTVAQAVTEEQRMHLSRMLATQACQAGLGPGVEFVPCKNKAAGDRQIVGSIGRLKTIQSDILTKHLIDARSMNNKEQSENKLAEFASKEFDITEKPVEISQTDTLQIFKGAFQSIMRAEEISPMSSMVGYRLLVKLATRFDFKHDGLELVQMLIDFIVSEHKARGDLAVLWIMELFRQLISNPNRKDELMQHYEFVMETLIEKMFQKTLYKELAFHKIFLESPILTGRSLYWLEQAALDPLYGPFCLITLREMIIARSRQRSELVKILFNLSVNEGTEIANQAGKTIKELYELTYIRPVIFKYLKQNLDACLVEPPTANFAKAGEVYPAFWNERLYRVALTVYLDLIPIDPTLVHQLSKVYSLATNALKKVILRMLEIPIREINMKCPDITELVNNCPIGSETLVARVIHLLSERNSVTSEIVLGMKKLHNARKTDIRSLIPVLSGLSQAEILSLLPKLILDPVNQKSVPHVFRRVLQSRHPDTGLPPISPIDFVVIYHHLQPQDELQRRLHLQNLEILYSNRMMTADVVSAAAEILLDDKPLCDLFYHTLVCIHQRFEQLDGYLSNVLVKLIAGNLWKENEEHMTAFFKSLEKLGSLAYPVILTGFTSTEFKEFIKTSHSEKDLLSKLAAFLPQLSTHQQRSMSQTILDLVKDKITGDSTRRNVRR